MHAEKDFYFKNVIPSQTKQSENEATDQKELFLYGVSCNNEGSHSTIFFSNISNILIGSVTGGFALKMLPKVLYNLITSCYHFFLVLVSLVISPLYLSCPDFRC